MAKKDLDKAALIRMNQIQEGFAISQALMNSLALGCDIEHRAIYLFGEIDQVSAYRFIATFKWLDRTEGPIHILLNSPGGEAENGMAIYECFCTASNATVIEAMGQVASAAVPVLLAGTARFANPETTVMIHSLSYEIEGMVSTPVVHALSRDADALNKRYYEIIAERTGKSIKDVEKWCHEETCFSAADALKHGFIDRVLDQRALPKSFEDAIAEVNGTKEPGTDKFEEKPEPKKARKKKAKKG